LSQADAGVAIVHVVRPGDTLASIADQYYGDPRRENVLVADNGLTDVGGSAIVVGLRLNIPSVSFHLVKEGETWSGLAMKFYGDTRRAFVLWEANGGSPGNQPDSGAELLIPYPLRHVTGQNDTLRLIAKIYYNGRTEDIVKIRRFNGLRRSRLQRGQIVLIPVADLLLSEQGRRIAEQQFPKINLGGDVRDKQKQIDAELVVLRENVRQGRFADAIAIGNRLLGGGDLTGNQIVTIQREIGVSYIAISREDLAVEAFKVCLERQSDMELDSAKTSPKVLRIFEQAKRESREQQSADLSNENAGKEKDAAAGATPKPVQMEEKKVKK